MRKQLVVFAGISLFLPGSAHWRAGCGWTGRMLSVAHAVGWFFVDRGHRAARISFAALGCMYLLDFVGGLAAARTFNQGRSLQRVDTAWRGSVILLVSMLGGFVLAPLVPPIPPAKVRENLRELVERMREPRGSDECDPRREKCVKPQAPPVWQEDGRWW